MFTRSLPKPFVTAAACLALGALAPALRAQCSATLPSRKPVALFSPGAHAHLALAALEQDDRDKQAASIVGMWRVTFTAKSMNGSPIPDTVIDEAIVIWHDDKTEIMNSGRPPQDGNFCLGVWEQIAPRTYQLNHFAWAGNSFAPTDPSGTVGQAIGPVQYREYVVLGPAGLHYAGTFSLDQYDTSGKVATAFTGTLKATRITLNTTADQLR